MKICLPPMRFCAVLLVVLNGACLTTSPKPLRARLEGSPGNEIKRGTNNALISREQAITIANEDAAKHQQPLKLFHATVCERARLWVIIYDEGGPEYYIDKISGAIVSVQQLPQNLNVATADGARVGDQVISEREAVEVAKKHFVDFLVSKGNGEEQVTEYDTVTCELAHSWRVFFEYRALPGESLVTLPNSNPPNYLIDKKSGGILYTTHQMTE